MLIKRKVYFSAIDEETGEERLFSADSIITEEEYLKLYSERTKLEDIQSHRGLGRSLVFGGVPGAIGGYVGKSAANKADEEGKSDKEIMKAAKSSATKAGLIGAGVGTAVNAKNLKESHRALTELGTKALGNRSKAAKISAGAHVAGTAIGAAITAGAARWGAKKNTEKRLAKRAIKDSEE